LRKPVSPDALTHTIGSGRTNSDGGIASAAAIGLFFANCPARRAVRLDPFDAVKLE
jgi:hypothetical protein